jgi:hypothetical protein
MATSYYRAKEVCYVADRYLQAGDGLWHDFGKDKVPPYLEKANAPVEVEAEPAVPALAADERAELAALRGEVVALRNEKATLEKALKAKGT